MATNKNNTDLEKALSGLGSKQEKQEPSIPKEEEIGFFIFFS